MSRLDEMQSILPDFEVNSTTELAAVRFRIRIDRDDFPMVTEDQLNALEAEVSADGDEITLQIWSQFYVKPHPNQGDFDVRLASEYVKQFLLSVWPDDVDLRFLEQILGRFSYNFTYQDEAKFRKSEYINLQIRRIKHEDRIYIIYEIRFDFLLDSNQDKGVIRTYLGMVTQDEKGKIHHKTFRADSGRIVDNTSSEVALILDTINAFKPLKGGLTGLEA